MLVLQVEATCASFNNIAHLLHLIPSTAENAFGLDYELRATTSQAENHKFVTSIKVTHCLMYKLYDLVLFCIVMP